MSELENILNHTDGEIPEGKYTILKVKNIKFPQEDLNDFKAFIIAFLKNKELRPKDELWETILPMKVIEFTKQLTDHDYRNDDLISHPVWMIDILHRAKDWTWYSSKVTSNGFEVNFTGAFHGIFLTIVHHLGIPHASMFIVKNGVEYPTKAVRDVLEYRKWNPKTLVLSPGEFKGFLPRG